MAPKLVVFDAVGTLIKPVVGVIETYHSTGKQFGSQLTADQVRGRFRQGRIEIFRHGTNLESSDEIECDLWRQLVEFVFCDIPDTQPLFEALWNKFAQVESWAKYGDVDDCLTELKENGITVVVGSNFDSRLLVIADELFGAKSLDQVFCSSLLGHRKPSPSFYRHIAERYPGHQITMIGDDFENDVAAPRQFGWNAIQIERREERSSVGSIGDLHDLTRQIF